MGNPQQVTYLLPVRAAGDFLSRLQANPTSTRAALERYVIATYPAGTNLAPALAALQADPYVAAAYQTPAISFSSAELTSFTVGDDSGSGQYGRDDLNINAAWQIAGGYALIADIDSGLYTSHLALQQFDSQGHYVGGNFIPVESIDISLTGLVDPPQNDSNVDERRPMQVLNTLCNPNAATNPNIPPAKAGHGTHTAGLMAANGAANLGVEGTCRDCGISMWKTAFVSCDTTTHLPVLLSNFNAIASALTLAGDGGSQVANMSLGLPNGGDAYNYCQNHSQTPICLAIKHNGFRDIVMVASSGNARERLDFPASDSRVVSAGGFQENLAIWDMSPGSNTNRPPVYGPAECGSNYTLPGGTDHQELVASAQSVLSATYPGFSWSPEIKCGDQFPGPGFGNGIGWCTGTSMSAPQLSGVIGLLRSINPLVRGGADPTVVGTIRNVLTTSTGQGWTPTLGYGIPEAAKATQKMLGKVAGVQVRNRVTPLFRLYSAATHDYADTTDPQGAVALIISTTNAWVPPTNIPTVPNYPSFPYDPADAQNTPIPAPRAKVYVLTTEVRPRNEWPALVPLYLMDKPYPTHDDFTLATTTDIAAMHNNGYNLRNIQGYIYKPCTPEPGCIPPVAEKFYRACNSTYNDCATFLQSEASTFAAAGYPPAGGTPTLLGYAYPATDSDGDGLPDGFEYVVGTDPTRADSDGDGIPDGVEYPMVGVPVTDPCAGGTGALHCLANDIFKDGFEFL